MSKHYLVRVEKVWEDWIEADNEDDAIAEAEDCFECYDEFDVSIQDIDDSEEDDENE